jgi:hypothetical protein
VYPATTESAVIVKHYDSEMSSTICCMSYKESAVITNYI